MGPHNPGHPKPHAGLHAARAEPHATPHEAPRSRTQACTEVHTRPRRPTRKPGRSRGVSPGSRLGRRLPPPRLWKLTGCGKLRATGRRPRTFPQPLEIPTSIHRPGIPTATHSLGDEEPGRKKRKRKTANLNFSICRAPGLGRRLPPGHPCELRPLWDDHPTTHPLKLHPPRDDQPPPGRADAIAPARAPASVGRPPVRPPSHVEPAWVFLVFSSRGVGEQSSPTPKDLPVIAFPWVATVFASGASVVVCYVPIAPSTAWHAGPVAISSRLRSSGVIVVLIFAGP